MGHGSPWHSPGSATEVSETFLNIWRGFFKLSDCTIDDIAENLTYKANDEKNLYGHYSTTWM